DVDRDLLRLQIVRDVLCTNSDQPAMMYDLTWIEEPVRRWDAAGHRAVRSATGVAIASGENLTGLEQYRSLLDAEAVDVVQAGSVWGITHFLRVAVLALGRDLPVSPVAYDTNPVAHAAAAVPNHLATELQDLR